MLSTVGESIFRFERGSGGRPGRAAEGLDGGVGAMVPPGEADGWLPIKLDQLYFDFIDRLSPFS